MCIRDSCEDGTGKVPTLWGAEEEDSGLNRRYLQVFILQIYPHKFSSILLSKVAGCFSSDLDRGVRFWSVQGYYPAQGFISAILSPRDYIKF